MTQKDVDKAQAFITMSSLIDATMWGHESIVTYQDLSEDTLEELVALDLTVEQEVEEDESFYVITWPGRQSPLEI